jgi:hypothetical protein
MLSLCTGLEYWNDLNPKGNSGAAQQDLRQIRRNDKDHGWLVLNFEV